MDNKLPEHLQKIIDKRAKLLKECGAENDPSEFLIECRNEAEKRGDDNALIHAVV